MSTGKCSNQIYNFFMIISIIFFYFTGVLLSQQKNDALKITIMSYNIRVAVDEGINSWQNRKEKVATMIRFHHADVVGFQEALKDQLDDLIELLPEYSWQGVGRDDGKEKGEYSAILYKRDKFQLLGNSTFWLSEAPDTVSIGWDAALPRIVTWILLKDNETQRMFYHFNTHFDHVGVEARKNSSKLILKKVREITAGENSVPLEKAVVITGDFNSRPESDVYKIMTEEFSDAKNVSKYGHYGSAISFNAFGKHVEEGDRIDFIFVNNKVNVEQHGIIGERIEGNYPSDHMPVVAEILIR
jgi:endonuclease/exonuclease/phosphatase family metal-dependent hydrolase